MADYALVRQAAARVDFTDWEKKTTTQQRTALKRSGLTEEEQWTLLNRDSSYLETLSVISDLRDNRMEYGLSAAETEQIGGELLTIAAARANATGNEQPYLGTIPRGQMVKYLDEQRDGLLRSIGYLDVDTVGGDTGLWYDGEEESKSDSKAVRLLSPKERLEMMADDPDMTLDQQNEIVHALLKIKTENLTEAQQKRLLKQTQKTIDKLEAIKTAPEPEWMYNSGDYAASLGLKTTNYDYHDGEYWLEVWCNDLHQEIPLGKTMPEKVVLQPHKATAWDIFGRNLGQYLEIVTMPENIIDTMLYLYGIDYSISNVPVLGEIVEELNYWKNTSHVTEDTISVHAWIYTPTRYGNAKDHQESIRFYDEKGM